MFNWVKSLFTKETTVEEVKAVEPAPIAAPQHFHVERRKVEKNTPDFESMTKLEIDVYARQNLKLNLDRRRTKEHMIEQINNHINKEN